MAGSVEEQIAKSCGLRLVLTAWAAAMPALQSLAQGRARLVQVSLLPAIPAQFQRHVGHCLELIKEPSGTITHILLTA